MIEDEEGERRQDQLEMMSNYEREKLERAFEKAREKKKLSLEGQRGKNNVNSRVFAIFLIAMASLYVFIMICQAYRNNLRRMNLSQS
mmetsp:Transcript_14794/g.25167  ORF Transcript_14794/g.25167 Transcript_14794/m.25167 type:complete len:87 (-) Transcript_14794:351-611(-)